MAHSYSFSAYAIPVAVTALLIISFGARLLIRTRNAVTISFFGVTAVVAIWLSTFTFMYLSRDAALALHWAKLAYLGVPLIAPAIYQFAAEVLQIRKRRRAAIAAGWILGAIASGTALFTNHLVRGIVHYWWGWYPVYTIGVGLTFLAYFFGYLIAVFVEFIRAYPSSTGVERTRIRMFLAGLGVAYLGCVDYLPKYGVPIYPFGYLAILGFLFIVARSVRVYDLLTITPSFAATEIVGTIADALFVCDRHGVIKVVNPAACQLLGYEQSELIGRALAEFMTSSADLSAANTRQEFVFTPKDGDPIDTTLSIAPLMRAGERAGAVIIVRDVRERKRADREIRRAATLLASTLDSTADGILVIDEDGAIHSYNKRFVEMWQIPQHILDSRENQKAIDFVLDQLADPEEFLRGISQLADDPEAESFDVVKFKDGRFFERYSIGRRIEDVATVRVWSFRDVTARFVTDAALRQSEARYRLLFEQNAAGVCLTTADGTIADCNATFASLVGATREELAGAAFRDLYVRPFEFDDLFGLLTTQPIVNGVEAELARRNGGTITVLQNLSLVGTGPHAAMHATVVDISARKRAEEQIEFNAYHDVLTKLPNRRLFTDRLNQNLTHAKRSNHPIAVMYIDIDRFKSFNDLLGHDGGDELLLEIAARLSHCVREEDTVARLGSDEFAIIVTELRRPEDAISVVEKVLEIVQLPVSLRGTALDVTASIGVALYPADGADGETLLLNADKAMDRAKEAGRSTYQLCTDEMKNRAMERLSLEAKLRRAISEEQLLLMYQPQVNLATGRIIGAEALVRWNDPEKGMVPPAAFIPIAEESRLILPLGAWVLRRACRQMREWLDNGVAPPRVAVNLSARQFQQHDLVASVRQALAEFRLDGSHLELEITETTAMQNAEATTAILHSLRALGVGISIDDFGTGYSSLNYLKRFPINAVKIDRAFVKDAPTDESDAAIVSAVIGMARSLKLRVVAEGLETADQFAFLRHLGCEEAQGFYFSRPVLPEAIPPMLAQMVVGANSTFEQARSYGLT